MAGLQVPLSTLCLAPRNVLRMTRGQSGLLFLHCWRLALFTRCRSPGAQAHDFFRFVRSGENESNDLRRVRAHHPAGWLWFAYAVPRTVQSPDMLMITTPVIFPSPSKPNRRLAASPR